MGWGHTNFTACCQTVERCTCCPRSLTRALIPPHLPLQHVPEEWNGFAYVYEGKGRIGDKAAQPEHAYVLHNEGDTVRARGGRRRHRRS